MGTNSNRSRIRCKQDGCNELTRSNSGLCRAHMQTPAEAVIIRKDVADPIEAVRQGPGACGQWNARGPLTWRDGVVTRERLAQTSTMPAEAPQTFAPTCDRTETDNASHSASGCGHAGIARGAVDSAHTTRDSEGAWAFSIIIVGAVGVGFLMSPYGQQLLAKMGLQ